MENLYVIEGTSNSGKSTTSQFISEYQRVLIVPEFSAFPESPNPSKSLEEEILNQQVFFEIERRRMKHAKRMVENGKIVFSERDFLSILAVCYAFKKLEKYDAYENANKLYREMKESTWFNEPNFYFFLTASHDEILARNITRGKELKKEWLMNSFDYYQKEFYDTINKEKDNNLVIDTTEKEPEYASKVIAKKLNLRR